MPPTRSEPPAQTETETQTRSENRTSTQTSTQTATETRTQTAVQTQTATSSQTASATPKPPQGTGAASSNASGSASSTPVWLWWLLGAVVLAAVIASVLLLRRRSKKHAWADEFILAKHEVVWLTRELLPQLSRAPTAGQTAGGWRIEAGRVVATEDRLTRLEATAVDGVSRRQARTLRDAVRAARTHLGALDNAADTATAKNLLRSTAADLETALSSVDTAVQPSTGQAGPR